MNSYLKPSLSTMKGMWSLLFLTILAASTVNIAFCKSLSYRKPVCQCTSEKIPDLSLRSRIVEATGSSLDDSSLQLRWYSALFEGDTYRIPDSSKMPQLNTCGAYYPIYISGIHPDIDELNETSVMMTCCIKSEFGDCDDSVNVHIRKCNGEIQYLLTPTYFQYSSYCFDPPNLQDTDSEDFEDSPGDVSVLRAEIKISLHYVGINPKIVIDCDVQTEGDTTGLFFVTAWYVNSELSWSFTKLGSTVPFEEDQLAVSGLGINIACSVGLKKSEMGKMTPFVSSEAYFAGIEVLTPEVILDKSETSTVNLRNTLPFGVRDYSTRNPVQRAVQMAIDLSVCSVEGDLQAVVADQKQCGISFNTLYPEDKWIPEEVTMEIATKDMNEGDKGRYVLQLQVQDSIEHPVWNGYKLQDILVTVTDEGKYKNAICRSTNDPHMTTSDGYAYEHQHLGEFVLYRNKKYPIEVQMKTKKCYSVAYCTCAVAVRAGGDVYLADHCSLNKRINTMTSCSDEGILDIYRKNDQYIEINTPIGTKITININKHDGLMNMAIKMSPKDVNNVEGLCGHFDGLKTNDLVDSFGKEHTLGWSSYNKHDTFSASWKVSGQNFLKHNEKRCLDHVETWKDMGTSIYCTCSCLHQNGTCKDKVPTCSPSQYLTCPVYISSSYIVRNECALWNRRCKSDRRKRQAEIIPLMSIETPVRQKRELKNITEEEAEKICRHAISDQHIIDGMEDVARGFNITQAILDCVFDTFETQSDEWVQDYVTELNTIVKIKLEKDPDFVEANKERVEVFERQSCLSNCSGNGVCTVKGFCDCYEGFSGSDCTISKTAKLNIYGVEGNGVCDLQHGDNCESFEMFTLDLTDGFVCRIVEQQILLNGSKLELPPIVENGGFIDNYNGECFLNSARRRRSVDESKVVFGSTYEMYISNDGKTFSNRAPLIVMDSLCQEIINGSNGDTIFVLKEGTCFITGKCYSSNDYNVYDKCEQCFPEMNPFQWTKGCAQTTDGFPAVNVLAIVLGTVIPVVLILLAVAAICFAHKHNGKQKRCVTPQNTKFGGLQ